MFQCLVGTNLYVDCGKEAQVVMLVVYTIKLTHMMLELAPAVL